MIVPLTDAAVDSLWKSTGLLKRLPKALIAKLLDGSLRGEAKAGSTLFLAGKPADGLYLIETGLLKAAIESSSGDERIVSLIGPGEIVGELAMIDGRPRAASVVVLTDCSFRFVRASAFQKFTAAHPEFYRELVLILSMRLRDADHALVAATSLSAKGRLARALLELAKHLGQPSCSGGITFKHKISNSDLAAMAGMARENVSRILGEWRERNLMSQRAQYQCINDIAALEHEIELAGN